jgi:hypothetical protein
MSLYDVCTDFFKNYEEVSAADFYRELFPKGELQKRDESHNWKYNAIACEISEPVKRFTIGDDLEHLDDLLKSENFVIMSPISYVGKARTAKNARLLYALVFDLDGIKGVKGLTDLFFQMQNDILPYPTFTVNSGNGLHLYYFLDIPVPLFPSVTMPLEKLKNRLTRQIWNQYVTNFYEEKNVQYEPIWQPFRIVGGITKDFKKTGHRSRAWRTGKPVSLEQLNRYVPEEYRMPKNAIQYKSEISLEEAKEKYPGWYERRILNHEKKKHWTVKTDLYEWWLRRIKNETVVGKRYYCIMCLAIYAKKCGIEFERLKNDAEELQQQFDKMTVDEDNHFTKKDVKDALEAYRDEFCTMPINSIVHFSGIPIEKNKRNGRDQKTHLARARAVQKIDYPNNEWAGRPSYREAVFKFLDLNPSATVTEFCELTNMSRRVFFKYKSLWLEKKKTDYDAYRKRFAFASIFDNCVKDAQTGEPVDLLQMITGMPTPKEPLSYEEWIAKNSSSSSAGRTRTGCNKTITTQHNEQK